MTIDHRPHQLPSVSVVIPVFRDQAGVSRCLDALARQTYPSRLTQVVVVDNDPRHPMRFDHDYPFELLVVPCEKPGSYAARNAGVRASGGSILAFTDADCLPTDVWLEKGIAQLEASAGPTILGGDVVVGAPSPRSGTGLYQYLMGFRQKENVEHRGFAVTANLLCARDVYACVGEFDERLLSGGDQEWCLRAAGLGIATRFSAEAAVSTPPRTTLASAARQARRVAAGRMALQAMGVARSGGASIHHQGNRLAFLWSAFRRAELGYPERAKVLLAAIVLRGVTAFEAARLRFGGEAERR